MARGRFITLEGGEGAGKSTQIAHLTDRLRGWGCEVLQTREPGGSAGAERIRELLVTGDTDRWDGMTEALLHFAARRDHLVRTVYPALEKGIWVLSDRFADSTMAYQGYGHGLGRDAIERLYQIAVGDFEPDLTLILDLPVEEGLSRTGSRGTGEDRYERMDVAFHHRLRDGFLDIARRAPERCAVIDASGNIEQVADEIGRLTLAKFAELGDAG
ncbi:MAG: dTMP kinase [Alphaproteobacteria bacterium]